MKISVNKYTLIPDTVDGGTAGSHGLESLEFDFSPEWEELSRTVTFFPPKSAAKCVSFTGDTLPIPASVTSRAGKVAYVLCGAKDGVAVITVTGVIQVASTLYPTDTETEEHIPGALEQATLMCAEARTDAQAALNAYQAAMRTIDSANGLAEEVEALSKVVNDVYGDILDVTKVHPTITETNRLDLSHPVSVAGLTERLDDLLKVISPFNIKIVDSLPANPDQTCIYIFNRTPLIYSSTSGSKTYYRWQPSFIQGGGPAPIYTLVENVSSGVTLYWSSEPDPTSEGDLSVYNTIINKNGDELECADFNAVCTLSADGKISLSTSSAEPSWQGISAATNLTPYLKDSAMLHLIEGGGA